MRGDKENIIMVFTRCSKGGRQLGERGQRRKKRKELCCSSGAPTLGEAAGERGQEEKQRKELCCSRGVPKVGGSWVRGDKEEKNAKNYVVPVVLQRWAAAG